MTQADIDALLPLPPAAFHILVALSAGDRHGYGIIQDVEASTAGAVRLSPGTLYRTIQRIIDCACDMSFRVGLGDEITSSIIFKLIGSLQWGYHVCNAILGIKFKLDNPPRLIGDLPQMTHWLVIVMDT